VLRCAGGAGRREWQRGKARRGAAPRPPQLHRRHEACTDCTPLDPVAFVEHLKTVAWYRNQVGTAGCAAPMPGERRAHSMRHATRKVYVGNLAS
jgi:hypothetical protein